MTYAAAVAELEKRARFSVKAPSLDRMKAALSALGMERWPFFQSGGAARTIVVAGTNGKGSTCAALDALFLEQNLSTGFYSSPHLVDYTERIRISGRDVDRDQFAVACEAVEASLKNSKEVLNELTHFEFLTLMALWILVGPEMPGSAARKSPVDRLILEVGLGGTFDATNAVPHETAVICRLGLDHQNILGGSLTDITRNKLGIAPIKGLVVHQPFTGEASAVADEYRSRLGGRWVECPKVACTAKSGHPPLYEISTPWGVFQNGLAGIRGAENAALALATFEALGSKISSKSKALSQIRWPGRMELVTKTDRGTPVYVSGDHNAQGFESLSALLGDYPRKKLHILAAVGVDKNLDGIMGKLFEIPNAEISLTATKFHGRHKKDYGNWISRAKSFEEDPVKVYSRLREVAGPYDMILITGSLYLVGDIKRFLT